MAVSSGRRIDPCKVGNSSGVGKINRWYLPSVNFDTRVAQCDPTSPILLFRVSASFITASRPLAREGPLVIFRWLSPGDCVSMTVLEAGDWMEAVVLGGVLSGYIAVTLAKRWPT